MAIKMTDFHTLNLNDVDMQHIKVLLGAVSCMYDDQITRHGLDPKELRKIANEKFTVDLQPLQKDEYKAVTKIRRVSFNLFRTVDTYETTDGWTDYGDEDLHHTGFRLEYPFRIVMLEFRDLRDQFHPHPDEVSLLGEGPISSLDAFRRFGVGLFREIAKHEDWETIIRSFVQP